MFDLPAAADAPHPTTCPWDDSASVHKACTQVKPARDQALRPVLAMVE